MPSSQTLVKANKSQKTQFERIAEDVFDASVADEITQEMLNSNTDIHTLATQSEMKRKYAILGTRGDVYK